MSKNSLDFNNLEKILDFEILLKPLLVDLEKMVKVTRSSAKKNEEIEELVDENSETELEYSDSEEEEESCMELSETDEDSINVSNIFVIIFIRII